MPTRGMEVVDPRQRPLMPSFLLILDMAERNPETEHIQKINWWSHKKFCQVPQPKLNCSGVGLFYTYNLLCLRYTRWHPNIKQRASFKKNINRWAHITTKTQDMKHILEIVSKGIQLFPFLLVIHEELDTLSYAKYDQNFSEIPCKCICLLVNCIHFVSTTS